MDERDYREGQPGQGPDGQHTGQLDRTNYANWILALEANLEDLPEDPDLEELAQQQVDRYVIPGYYRQDIQLPNGWTLPEFFLRTHRQTLLACIPRHCDGASSPCAGHCPLEAELFRGKVCPVELYRLAQVFHGLAREFGIRPENTADLQLIRQIAIDTVIAWRAEVLADPSNLVEDVAGIIQPGRGSDSEGQVIYRNVLDPQLALRMQVQQHSAKALELLMKRRRMISEERRYRAKEEREEALLQLMQRRQELQERLATGQKPADSLTQLHQIIDSWAQRKPARLIDGAGTDHDPNERRTDETP